MRFLVDMALAPGVATWLVEQSHDAVHASAVGLDRARDSEIIERARTDDRVIVTADLDYPRLLVLARAERPGLILFRGGPVRLRPSDRAARPRHRDRSR